MNTGGGASGFGQMAQTFTTNMTGVGSAVMYVFMLMGLVLTGVGVHGFYGEHKSGRGEYGKPAAATAIGILLVAGLAYLINTGSNTLGAGTNPNLQNLLNP
jgi:hypothetical protein